MPEPIKFYTDTHIDKQIAIQLRLRGVDIIRCEEVGKAEAKDEDHLIYAANEERIILTCDKDFLRLDKEWRLSNREHAGIGFMPGYVCSNISVAVEILEFWHQAVLAGVATVEGDFYNRVKFVK